MDAFYVAGARHGSSIVSVATCGPVESLVSADLGKSILEAGLIASALVGVLAWATWRTADQIIVESCSPDGLFAKLSAVIYGNTFWRAELAGVARWRQSAENWDQVQTVMRARLDDIRRQSEANVNTFFEAHPNAAPPRSTIRAQPCHRPPQKLPEDECRPGAALLGHPSRIANRRTVLGSARDCLAIDDCSVGRRGERKEGGGRGSRQNRMGGIEIAACRLEALTRLPTTRAARLRFSPSRQFSLPKAPVQ